MNQLVFSEFVVGIFPGGSISCQTYYKRQSHLFGFFFESGIQGFDGNTIRAPVSSILVLIATEQDDSFLLALNHGFDKLLEFVEGNHVGHCCTNSR